MSKTAVYNTTVSWKGAHWGYMVMGNGPEMAFSAPPDAEGHAGVLTPEDAYVGAINSCIMMMFIWASERLKLDLRSYDCRGEGTKVVALDHTEIFSEVRLSPVIKVGAQGQDTDAVEKRVRKALKSAEKYSLIANSVKSSLIIEPAIEVVL
jgi:organic hydroperoxide reductase OsmC/OhrA